MFGVIALAWPLGPAGRRVSVAPLSLRVRAERAACCGGRPRPRLVA
ncbi:MAG: hypothetical protein IH959_06475 [Chloroflexi bacterium]|nr:hypothetical protein [Chloroflexota bacterium]